MAQRRHPQRPRGSITAVPSVLSCMIALLNMRKVLKTEKMRQMREVHTRLVAANASQTDLDDFAKILDGSEAVDVGGSGGRVGGKDITGTL